MHNIDKYTDLLIEELKNSESFKKYEYCKDEIEKDPELKKKLNEFRMKNYKLQNSPEQIDLYDISDKITDEYTQMRDNPIVDGFLESELALCKTIQHINNRLVEVMDLLLLDVVDDI